MDDPLFVVCFYLLVKNRLITPKTCLEELVTMQCHELEEAMMKEVISFYQRFNQKLTVIKHQYTQGHDVPQNDCYPLKPLQN